MTLIDLLNWFGRRKRFRFIGKLLLLIATSIPFWLLVRIAGRRIVTAFAGAPAILMTHSDLRNLLNESSLTERKSFIRSFVKEVKVTGNDVLLTYTMPLPPQGISQEKVGVLCSVQHGRADCTKERTFCPVFDIF